MLFRDPMPAEHRTSLLGGFLEMKTIRVVWR